MDQDSRGEIGIGIPGKDFFVLLLNLVGGDPPFLGQSPLVSNN